MNRVVNLLLTVTARSLQCMRAHSVRHPNVQIKSRKHSACAIWHSCKLVYRFHTTMTCDASVQWSVHVCCRIAEEPLIKAIMNTSMTITRAHATKLLQRWFYISLRSGVAVEGLARRHFEGVTLDTQVEEMSGSEAEMWADDDAVMQWVLQFTGGGPEGNLFQANVDVSLLTFLCSCCVTS